MVARAGAEGAPKVLATPPTQKIQWVWGKYSLSLSLCAYVRPGVTISDKTNNKGNQINCPPRRIYVLKEVCEGPKTRDLLGTLQETQHPTPWQVRLSLRQMSEV